MKKSTFDNVLGAKLINSKKGYCRIKLDVKPKHLNAGGIVHGGVLASLCDVSLAGAVSTVMQKGKWCVTAQLNVEFLLPALPNQPIFGFGRITKMGNTLAFVEGGVETKDKKLLTRATGIWIMKNVSRIELISQKNKRKRSIEVLE